MHEPDLITEITRLQQASSMCEDAFGLVMSYFTLIIINVCFDHRFRICLWLWDFHTLPVGQEAFLLAKPDNQTAIQPHL